MAVTVTCTKCAHTLKAKDVLAGKKVMCPKCQAIILVPALPQTAPPAPGRADEPSAPGAGRPVSGKSAGPIHPRPHAMSREQLAAAFQGQVAIPRVSLARKFGAILVLGVLLLLAAGYLALLAALAWLVYWLATHDFGSSIPSVAVTLAMGGSVVVMLCLLRPLFMPHERSQKAYLLRPGQEPVVAELVGMIGKQLDAPPLSGIQIDCSPRMSLDRTGRTLTLGLGLVAGLSTEQLAGLVAGAIAQHRSGAASGTVNLIRAINGWLWRTVYQQDRFEQWITRLNLRPGFHLGRLVLPLRPLSFLARAALWVPMFIGNTVAAALVRRTELDADLCAARLVGQKTFVGLVDRVKIIEYTWEGILAEISFLYKEQKLPDSLPHELAARMRDTTPELAAALIESVIKPEEIPFDARPSEAERTAVVAAEPAQGALTCPQPATALWTDFGKLARDVSFEYYSATLGAQHLKSALRRVE